MMLGLKGLKMVPFNTGFIAQFITMWEKQTLARKKKTGSTHTCFRDTELKFVIIIILKLS